VPALAAGLAAAAALGGWLEPAALRQLPAFAASLGERP
jgi:hypothetical protein